MNNTPVITKENPRELQRLSPISMFFLFCIKKASGLTPFVTDGHSIKWYAWMQEVCITFDYEDDDGIARKKEIKVNIWDMQGYREDWNFENAEHPFNKLI